MVFVGIDTHKSSLAVCLVDGLGRQLAVEESPNDRRGHGRLHGWVKRQAPGRRRFGIDSSGRLGHGLALYLLEQGEDVRDVRGRMTGRERSRLRGQGKSDPRDAYAIARVTAREQLAPVRTATVDRDLKLLCDDREQLLSERTRARNRLHAELVTLRPGDERRVSSLAKPASLEAPEQLLGRNRSVHARLARRRIERIREIELERAQIESRSARWCASLAPAWSSSSASVSCSRPASSVRWETSAGSPAGLTSPHPTAPPRSPPPPGSSGASGSTAEATDASTRRST
jgi:transposase